jgi:hypothetical protein
VKNPSERANAKPLPSPISGKGQSFHSLGAKVRTFAERKATMISGHAQSLTGGRFPALALACFGVVKKGDKSN